MRHYKDDVGNVYLPRNRVDRIQLELSKKISTIRPYEYHVDIQYCMLQIPGEGNR